MASYDPDEGQSPNESGNSCPRLPFRASGADRAAHTEARAELRDRETYYAELRLAVRSQSRSIPRPRAALDDLGADHELSVEGPGRTPGADGKIRSDGESWTEMTARFGDTWT